jgi:hypothetical protein
MLLQRPLPDDVVHNILSRLDAGTKYRLTHVSKRWSRYIWNHARCTEAAQLETLAMFRDGGDTLLGSPLLVKVTKLAQSPSRRQALVNWIAASNVRMDAGGFYVQQEEDMDFRGCTRVRISLWDWPLEEYERFYGAKPDDFRMCKRLREEFVCMRF